MLDVSNGFTLLQTYEIDSMLYILKIIYSLIPCRIEKKENVSEK